jgi:putative nucleotidyltransferase with HDIG domain
MSTGDPRGWEGVSRQPVAAYTWMPTLGGRRARSFLHVGEDRLRITGARLDSSKESSHRSLAVPASGGTAVDRAWLGPWWRTGAPADGSRHGASLSGSARCGCDVRFVRAVAVRRLLLVEVNTVLRARVIAQERLGSLAPRWAHVRGVAAAAELMIADLDASDADAVVAAAWLHDVGYAPSVARTGFHSVDGAKLVRESGFSELVVSLVAFHSGAEFEAHERGQESLLAAFTPPPQGLLDKVTYCDLTTGPDGTPICAKDRIAEVLHRYGADDLVHRAMTAARAPLLAAVARVEHAGAMT